MSVAAFPNLPSSAITLRSASDKTRAVFVPEWGGMMVSLQTQFLGAWRELLFLHDDFLERRLVDLPGGWPFCFPVCGRVARNDQAGLYMCDGKPYYLAIHGFAWQQAWHVQQHQDDCLVMQLVSSELTKKQYPFDFEVILTYRLRDDGLVCHQTYRNCGDDVMPFQAGFHPYFLTPPVVCAEGSGGCTKEDVRLTCQSESQLFYNENLSDIVDSSDMVATECSISDHAVNERLVRLGKDHRVGLFYPDGLAITIEAKGVADDSFFQYLQTYTMADETFICIEPWSGYPNAINTVVGMDYLRSHQERQAVLYLVLSQTLDDEKQSPAL